MKVQVNSDKTIQVDATLTSFIEAEATRLLSRFEKKLTRVEAHLSDIDNTKTGKPDKRCVIEARPTGDTPRTATAIATTTESAVTAALGKMQRTLTTFFGRKGRTATDMSSPEPTAKETEPIEIKPAKKSAAKKAIKLSPRGPKKTPTFQARRKAQPSR